MQNHFKYNFIVIIILICWGDLAYSDSHESHTLFSYSGYLTTPSAYISDAQLNFSYSYFSSSFPINDHIARKNSEIWIFSSCLGFFPFLEVFFSVYVLPSTNINDEIPNYGSDKWRSSGIKLKIINEKKIVPTIAIGITDPDVDIIGAKISSPNIKSRYLVLSKHFLNKRSSLSLGYGISDSLKPTSYVRLKRIFGGYSFAINKNIALLCDYDGKCWNGGLNFYWRKISIIFSFTEGTFLASGIGYNLHLLNK